LDVRELVVLIRRYYDGIEIHRQNKMVYAKFLCPHRVISTCRINGGVRDDLSYLFNHQMCEPNRHFRPTLDLAVYQPKDYHAMVCQRMNLPPETSAGLSTATNMNHAILKSTAYRDLEVITVGTGGVETNALRVGDPGSYYETDGHFEILNNAEYKSPGTINLMIFINQELTPGALVATVGIAAEARAAAMQELSVNSRYSSGLATGTGTDQMATACRITGEVALGSADKHSKLGELIGATVKQTVKASLGLHNEYVPQARARVLVSVERFGIREEQLILRISQRLSELQAEVLKNNFEGINRDPAVVAGVAALIHLWDKFNQDILPASCMPDVLCTCGAQIAAAVSGNHQRIHDYRNRLARANITNSDRFVTELIVHSIALGFSEKWED
jgi:adenosylcobinamide amidohydrolase